MKSPKKKIFIFSFIFFNFFLHPALSEKNQPLIKKTNHYSGILRDLVPKKQNEILSSLAKFAIQYYNSSNDIKRFLLKEKHKKFLSQNLINKKLTKWLGRIKKLQTTENGLAILEIELLKINNNNTDKTPIDSKFRVSVGTLKNSIEDSDFKTLILPKTTLYNLLANFQENEWIIFSGKILSADEYYTKSSPKIKHEAILSPKFILKFDFFEKINQLKSDIKMYENVSIENKNSEKKALKSKSITIRYYQNYRLSNYNWNFLNYMNRWHRLVRYHWNNHPPSDYLEGSNPEGGEVFVSVTVRRDGHTSNFQLNSIGEVSKIMLASALESVRVVPLPPLPEDLPDKELKVEFRFQHSRITNFLKKETINKKAKKNLSNKKSNNQNNLIRKKEVQIFKNEIYSDTKVTYHEELKQEFSSHFYPIYNFDPNLEILIDLALNKFGEIVKQKIISQSKSVRFQLAVMNSLSKVRFKSIPKSLTSQIPYSVQFRVIP